MATILGFLACAIAIGVAGTYLSRYGDVIARRTDDCNFPDPIWAAARRQGSAQGAPQRAAVSDARLGAALDALLGSPRN